MVINHDYLPTDGGYSKLEQEIDQKWLMEQNEL